MKILKDIIHLSWDYVRSKNPDALKKDVEDVIARSLGLKRLDIYINFDRPLEESELRSIREGIKRLAYGEPVQYIEGSVEFLDIELNVNSSVLIPRPETEILCEKIIQELKNYDMHGKVLLDLCTGSGCIGIALKKALESQGIHDVEVILSDLSHQALLVATENAKKNDVAVTFLQGDLFQALGSKKVDFLVCNPPYISDREFERLDRSVKDFEPKIALVSGGTGLEIYEKIARDIKKYVTTLAWFEIGATQGESVGALFTAQHVLSVRVEKDLAQHDRYVRVEL